MEKIKVGDKLSIHCYKHNGHIHSISDEAMVLEVDDEKIVCANQKTRIRENDGRIHITNEPAVLFFYKNNWYNVIGQLKSFGLFYYCNIASPFIVEDNTIKYIDYDLDLRVFPDGGFKVLDRNEYNYHRRQMHYPLVLDIILKKELTKLIEMKRNNLGPFTPGLIQEYYEKYEKLINYSA